MSKSKDIISERFDRNLALLQTIDCYLKDSNKNGQNDTAIEQLDIVRCSIAELKHAFKNAFNTEDQAVDLEPDMENSKKDTESNNSESDKHPSTIFLEARGWNRTVERYLDAMIDNEYPITVSAMYDELYNIQRACILVEKCLKDFYHLTALKWE